MRRSGGRAWVLLALLAAGGGLASAYALAGPALPYGSPADDGPGLSPGSRWRYDATLSGNWTSEEATDAMRGGPFSFAHFAWEERRLRDGEGREVIGRALDWTLVQLGPGAEWKVEARREWTADGETLPFAHDRPLNDFHVQARGLMVPLAAHVAWSEERERVGWTRLYGAAGSSCMSLAVSHQRAGSLEGTPLCLAVHGRPLDLRDRTTARRDGETLTILSGDGVRLTYSTQWPVPVRIESWSEGRTLVAWLASFEGPREESRPSLQGSPALSLEVAARRPWGIDDRGVPHPFPASAAHQAALAAPAWRDFADYMEASPDAILVWLEPGSGKDRMGRWDGWTFGFHDGRDPFAFTATRRTVLGSPVLAFASVDPEGLPLFFPTAQEPSLPTARSGLAAWEAFGSTEGQRHAGNGWGLAVVCAHDVQPVPCEAMRTVAWFGSAAKAACDALPGQACTAGTSGSRLILGPTGAILAATAWDETATAVSPAVGTGSGIPPPPAGKAGPSGLGLPGDPDGLDALGLAVGGAVLGVVAVKALAGLFSRVHGERVLRNASRQKVLALVRDRPGLPFLELKRAAGMGNGILRHHLDKLQAAGYIRSMKAGRYRCYLPTGQTRPPDQLAATGSLAARRILSVVADRPGIGAGDLAKSVQLSAPTASYHLRRLSSVGLLRTERLGRRVRVWPGPRRDPSNDAPNTA